MPELRVRSGSAMPVCSLDLRTFDTPSMPRGARRPHATVLEIWSPSTDIELRLLYFGTDRSCREFLGARATGSGRLPVYVSAARMTAQVQKADIQSNGLPVLLACDASAVDDVVASVNGQPGGSDVQRPALLLGERDIRRARSAQARCRTQCKVPSAAKNDAAARKPA
jgi:hypothetical protein